MKRKRNSDQPVTKKYLDKTLDKRFEDFEKNVDGKFVRSEIRFGLKLENLKIEIDEKAKKYRNQILNSNDRLAKTLETMREEIEIGNFQIREKLKNHEKRINVLEST